MVTVTSACQNKQGVQQKIWQGEIPSRSNAPVFLKFTHGYTYPSLRLKIGNRGKTSLHRVKRNRDHSNLVRIIRAVYIINEKVPPWFMVNHILTDIFAHATMGAAGGDSVN